MIGEWSSTRFDVATQSVVRNQYYEGTVVLYEGNRYIARTDHVTSLTFNADVLNGKWTRMGKKRESRWLPNTIYLTGDIVEYGHLELMCRYGHLSTNSLKYDLKSYNTNIANLQNPEHFNFKQAFSEITEHTTGDVVLFLDGILYECLISHYFISFIDNQVTESMPILGTNWEYYWKKFVPSGAPIVEKFWCPTLVFYFNKNDVISFCGKIYICTDDYASPTQLDSLSFFPYFGSKYKTKWEIFSVWEIITSNKIFLPGWVEEIPFISDYVSATDDLLLNNVEYPLVELNSIRDLGADTHIEVLKRTLELQGIHLSDYEQSLVDTSTLYHYASQFSQYRDTSGTSSFMSFLNFIVNNPTSLQKTANPLYTVSSISDSSWKLLPLYTRDYKTFWTDKELILMLRVSAKYSYIGVWEFGSSYLTNNAVKHKGWIWVCLKDTPSEPILESTSWVLAALVSDITYSAGIELYSPKVYSLGDLKTQTELEITSYIPVNGSPIDPVVSQSLRAGTTLMYDYEHQNIPDSNWVDNTDIENDFESTKYFYLNDPLGNNPQYGYYSTSRFYLYRTDRADCLGKDLDKYFEYVYKGDWDNTITYNYLDSVIHSDKLWKKVTDNLLSAEPKESSVDWIQIIDSYSIVGNSVHVKPDYLGILKIFNDLAPANHVIHIKEVAYDYLIPTQINMITTGVERCEIEECEYIPFITSSTIKYPTPVGVSNWVYSDVGTCVTCAQKLFTPKLPTL